MKTCFTWFLYSWNGAGTTLQATPCPKGSVNHGRYRTPNKGLVDLRRRPWSEYGDEFDTRQQEPLLSHFLRLSSQQHALVFSLVRRSQQKLPLGAKKQVCTFLVLIQLTHGFGGWSDLQWRQGHHVSKVSRFRGISSICGEGNSTSSTKVIWTSPMDSEGRTRGS